MAATLTSEKASERISPSAVAPEALHPLYIAGNYLRTATTLESSLRNLIYLRASQMNGCAFCIAMHWREAKEDGLSDDHLHGLLAWREAPWYTNRERAALAWTEALTDIAHSHASDEVYEQAHSEFTDRELVDLTLAITTINAWNRFMAGFRVNPETAPDVIAALKKTTESKTPSIPR